MEHVGAFLVVTQAPEPDRARNRYPVTTSRGRSPSSKFDEVYLGQVGGQLEGAFGLFAAQVLPQVRGHDMKTGHLAGSGHPPTRAAVRRLCRVTMADLAGRSRLRPCIVGSRP